MRSFTMRTMDVIDLQKFFGPFVLGSRFILSMQILLCNSLGIASGIVSKLADLTRIEYVSVTIKQNECLFLCKNEYWWENIFIKILIIFLSVPERWNFIWKKRYSGWFKFTILYGKVKNVWIGFIFIKFQWRCFDIFLR